MIFGLKHHSPRERSFTSGGLKLSKSFLIRKLHLREFLPRILMEHSGSD